MPFIEGETLRGKLDRETQLGVDESVKLTVAVADALDYAHRHGVIHRDIKPENILLHDGRPMVADFGIALALSAAAGGRMTETGMSLGTPHYMSPEQATAEKELTPRSDIYSLGSVLYEMLTGNPPHTGASAQQIIMKIVTEDAAPVTKLRKSVPPNVAAAVDKAIEKLPADRFATAAEFGAALSNSTYAPTVAIARPHVLTSSRPVHAAALIGITAAIAALATWALVRSGRTDAPVARYGLAFPDSQVPQGQIQISRDGSLLVYQGPGDRGQPQLWAKRRDASDAVPLASTTGAQTFEISPDARWLVFQQEQRMRKVPVDGGAPVTATDSTLNSGIAWLSDGSIVFTGSDFDLKRLPVGGGAATVLWTPDSVSVPAMPTALPGARGVLFTRCENSCDPSSLWVLDLKSGRARQLVPNVLKGWYLETGHLAFVGRDGAMFAVPFDLGSLEVRGTPVPVINGISLLGGIFPVITVSSTGTLVMQAGQATTDRGLMDMVWLDRAGNRTVLDSTWRFHLSRLNANNGWMISPNGKQLVIGLNTNSGDDIWIKQLPAGAISRATFDSASEQRPRWSPDGKFVSYIRTATQDLLQRRADGTGGEQLLLHSPGGGAIAEGRWSPDGKWVVLRMGGVQNQIGGRDIVGFRPGVDTAPVPLAANPNYDEAAPTLSPDGKWMAYESNETGRKEVYIRPFPNTEDGKWQVSTTGGQAPLWAHSGREIFFVDGDRNMVATAVTPGTPLQLGDRRVLFRMGYDLYLENPEHYTPFDISLDDQRFLMARQVQAASTERPRFMLVNNWFTELQSKVTGK